MAAETICAREKRLERKAKGFCVHCGKLAMPKRTMCEKCSKSHAEAASKWKRKKTSQGLCTVCGKYPKQPNSFLCALCFQHKRVRERYFLQTHEQSRLRRNNTNEANRQRYKKEGKCSCSRPLLSPIDDGYKCCHHCRTGGRAMQVGPNYIYEELMRKITTEDYKKEKRNANNKNQSAS